VYPEDEHRLTPRQPFEQVVQLERNRFFTGENAPVRGIGQGIDICPLGLCVKTEAPLQPKETVRVYLPVQAVDIPLPVFSEVRWVKAENNYYRAGLQFVR
jgi:PilZ domain-containing protein